eukprot:8608091-Pyramimonas_sp.AAC.1
MRDRPTWTFRRLCQKLADLPRITKCHTVTVADNKQGFSTSWGGNFREPHSDRTVFSFRSLRRAILGFLGMKFFRIGCLWLEQPRGIPIGWPLSGVILELVLSRYENAFDRAFKSRRKDVAPGRYVDDLCLMSRTRCLRCVCACLRAVHREVSCVKVGENNLYLTTQ